MARGDVQLRSPGLAAEGTAIARQNQTVPMRRQTGAPRPCISADAAKLFDSAHLPTGPTT